MSDTHAKANRMATAQGWTLRTLLDVTLDFIEERNAGLVFDQYLHERAAQDNRDQTRVMRRSTETITWGEKR